MFPLGFRVPLRIPLGLLGPRVILGIPSGHGFRGSF